ncbi:MAG: ATP-binding protein [Pseudopelagicola sp.]|nr:ATP-binding protein [Pseudopelagicola sp.]
MKFDVLGRISNMGLPDGKLAILYSVYEAVSNSVHAIEAKFGENAASRGEITVKVDTDGENLIEKISITDNGTGFTPGNLEAFDTSDSRFKEAIGGKGVGRLIWVKVFRSISVSSSYQDAGEKRSIHFDFVPQDEDSIQNIKSDPEFQLDHGSTVTLHNVRTSENEKVRRISFLRDLALHFFSYFMAGSMPSIWVEYNGDRSDLSEFIKGKIEPATTVTVSFEVEGKTSELTMSHMYVDSTISTELKNSILLTAHHRLVGDPVSIERKYALRELEGRKAYVGLVSGDFLNERVDQERLSFRLTSGQSDAMHSALLESAAEFLSDHIGKLQSQQKVTVQSLLVEHPQLVAQVKNIDSYVSRLSPGMDEEQIGENLFTLLYRDERKISRKIREYDEIESLDDEAKSEAEKVLERVSDQAKHRLAELVVKRRQVLRLARSFLRYRNDGEDAYHYEKAIHDLICPMGEMLTDEDYSRHNLWIVDDLLAYYQFFASDKQVRVLAKDSDSQKEPDLVFFNPLGFRREGTNDPVVLVEFKRPGDERPSKDPVDQVLEYIEKLTSKTVRDINGDVVSEIRKDTPFECYVVCDLTEGTRKILSRSLAAHETPDGEGYFGFAPNHKAAIHVISYKKMLRDAELRNEVFFRKLGLLRTA